MRILRIDAVEHVVLNAEVWDEIPENDNNFRFLVSKDGNVGDIENNGSFSKPPLPAPSVPHSVSMRQARLALLGAGLLDSVDAVVAQSPRAVQIEWEFATDVWRDRDLVASLGGALGLTDDQIDGLFIAAAAIP